MNTKSEAIDYFSFMKDIYNKMDNDGFTKDGEAVDLCGTFFYGNYAYTTNGKIIGRALVNDNAPIYEPIFWGYNNKSELGLRFLLDYKNYCVPNDKVIDVFNENFVRNLHKFFNKETTTSIFIKKNELLDCIESLYGKKEVTKMKTFLTMKVNEHYNLDLDFVPIKPTPKNQPYNSEIPVFISPKNKDMVRAASGDSCTISVYYLYNILKCTMKEYDVVGIKYSNNPYSPMIVYAKNNHDLEKNQTHWAISQLK